MSFKKFASDGARLADELEEEEDYLVNPDNNVVNRVGKTFSRLEEDQSEEGLSSIKEKHEELTTKRVPRKKSFCRNICRMWNYRKIVTQ